ELTVGDDQRALDGVLQFTDVAGPAVHQQELASLFGQPCLTASHPFSELAEEVVGQYEHVTVPLSQGGQMNAKYRESIVEIRAKTAIPDDALHVSVGGRDQADIGLEGRRSADALVLTLLQDPQELRLRRGRQLADLVEEQRAARGELEAAALQLVGSS